MAESVTQLRGKRVLVTGAGGFIGSHLTDRLAELGAVTRAAVRYTSGGSRGWLAESPRLEDVEVVTIDVTDRDTVRRAMKDVEVVFHLAALIGIPYSYDAPLSYVRTNVEGSVNVFQSALEEGVQRVIHTSTSEVYGTAQYVPIDEKHPLQGQSPYSASKIGADKEAEAFSRSYGLPVVTVRPFNTYGPRQSARAVIPTIVSQALARRPIRLGNLTPTRDLNFVLDTVDGFCLAAVKEAAVGRTLNLGTGQEISIGDLARKICTLMEVDLEIQQIQERVRPDLSEVARLCADAGQARSVLGWAPGHTLEAGLRQTIKWISERPGLYRVGAYAV
ncbi:MAG TPA: SDR family NAD(P)-dependent oxidoreductase [Candidatus Dormibacteraeota bacterium]|nr:SDR family NAD(P)-dependent oxidoreductase [Candidatus Dormibacteraeota bacterium]